MMDYLREMASYPGLYRRIAKTEKTVAPERVSFGSDKNQYLLHFAPKSEAKRTIVVWIHGGGWNAGTPDDFLFVGQRFALEGYHCLSLGYRLSPKNKYPAQLEDVCAGFQKGIKALKAQGIDCSQVVVTGPSAGAQLAAALCYDPAARTEYGVDIAPIAGYIGVAGPYLFQAKRTWTLRLLLKQLFARGYDRTKAEPCSFLAKSRIPMLLIHSRHDGVIDFSSAEAFLEKANSLGIPCELYEVQDRMNTHSAYSTGMFLETRAANQALDKLFGWIEAL